MSLAMHLGCHRAQSFTRWLYEFLEPHEPGPMAAFVQKAVALNQCHLPPNARNADRTVQETCLTASASALQLSCSAQNETSSKLVTQA